MSDNQNQNEDEDKAESSKRKRTESYKEAQEANPFWLTASSPPRFVKFEELISAVEGLDKMALAHEIAVNSDFRLQASSEMSTENEAESPTKSEQNKATTPATISDLHNAVHRIMHKAFWDSLRADLNETPPNYDHALVLFKEIKEKLLSLLLPHHAKLRTDIEERLDVELIEQQCKNNCFEFLPVANYILDVMSKLCAPVRDEAIKNLRELTDIVQFYKGILELLDAMKLDMANFTIASMRPAIQQHSVEYERKKFNEFLKINPDGLMHTTAWLQKATQSCSLEKSVSESHLAKCQATGTSSAVSSNRVQMSDDQILAEAYWSILEWQDYDRFPETLMVDQTRLISLRDQCLQLIIISSVILVTVNFGGKDFSTSNAFKTSLKETLTVLLSDCNLNSLADRLLSVSERVLADFEKYLNDISHEVMVLESSKKELLKKQLTDLSDESNLVRKIIRDRVKSFITTVIANKSASPLKFPSGLGVVEKELSRLTGSFLRLVLHNSAVFIEHYRKILADFKATTTNQEECVDKNSNCES